MGSLVELRVEVAIPARPTRYITECFEILVSLLLTKAEVKKIKRYLSMSQLSSCILEKRISRLP